MVAERSTQAPTSMSPAQRELANREVPHHCDKCEKTCLPYMSGLTPEALAALYSSGWLDCDYRAGFYKPCLPSARAHAWVGQIPPAAFDKYMEEHPEPFLVEDLRDLLPDHKRGFLFL